MSNKYDHIMQRLNALTLLLQGERFVLSETQLDKMESDLGCRLPADFREFSSEYSGCSMHRAAVFPLKSNLDGRCQLSIETFWAHSPDEVKSADDYYGYLLDMGEHWDLLPTSGVRLVCSYPEDVETIAWPKELLPIGESPSGHTICLAISGLRIGAVFCWLTSGEVYLAADSFDEFMNLLEIGPAKQGVNDEVTY